MKNYEYPTVHPPTSLQPPRFPTDTRFSWMDASSAQEDRVGTRSEVVAPLYQPESTQQNMIPGRAQLQSPEPPVNQQITPQYQLQGPVVAQQQYAQAPQQHGAYTAQPYPPAQVHLPQPQVQAPQYTVNPVPQPPEPVKQPPAPEQEAGAPIAPDVNPLTPTTPKGTHRASTNMAIVPPSADPSQFSTSTFTPTPQSIRGGSWQHNFCSCGEPSICVTGLFCPCIVYGKTQYRLGLRVEKKDPTNMLGYTAVNGSCIAFGLLCGINGILATIQRTRIRRTYGMSTESGNVAGDCLKGVCCCCCVVAQDEKEVKWREEQSRKPAGAGAKKEGYVAPTTMTFSPPPR